MTSSIYRIKVSGAKRKKSDDEEADKFEFTQGFKLGEVEAAKFAIDAHIKLLRQLLKKSPDAALELKRALDDAVADFFAEKDEYHQVRVDEEKLLLAPADN